MTSSGASSVFAGFRFPREVIAVAGSLVPALWLSYRDVEELLPERGVIVDHATVYRWVPVHSRVHRGAAVVPPCSG